MNSPGLVFVLIGMIASADPLDRLVTEAPGAEIDPEAGAVILRDEVKFEREEDDRTVEERHLVVKILDERGQEEFGVVRTRYDSKTQDFAVLGARTYVPTGEWVEASGESISDLPVVEGSEGSEYSRVLLKKVSFPGLVEGSVIDYYYRITSRVKREFFGEATLQANEPILSKALTLSVPRGTEIRWEVVNDERDPVITEEGKRTTYTWDFENMGKLVREPFAPSEEELSPRVLFTQFRDWDEVGRWLWKTYERAIEYPRNVVNRARELADVRQDETLRSIYLYVSSEIRNVPLSLWFAGYEPTPAGEVISNGFGDGKDKAVLLISMLRTVGIDAYPCFVSSKDLSLRTSVPSPGLFDGVLVAAVLNGEFVYLDPRYSMRVPGVAQAGSSERDDENMPPWMFHAPEYGGQDGFIVRENDEFFESIPRGSEEWDRSKTSVQLVLDGEGNVRGILRSVLTGYYARKAVLDLEGKTGRELEAYLEDEGQSIRKGIRIVASSISDLMDWSRPIHCTLEFEIGGYAEVQDGIMRVELPSNPLDFADVGRYLTLDERTQPLVIGTERSIVQEISLRLPDGYSVDQSPQDTLIVSDVARCEVDCVVSEDVLTCKKSLILKSKIVPAWEYSDFRRAYEGFSGEGTNVVLLKKY